MGLFRTRKSRVTMNLSVDGYVAGLMYDVAPALADEWIVLGYAAGKLTRDYSDAEIQAMHAQNQTVRV